MIDVQQELNNVLEKYRNSFYLATKDVASRLEIELNTILLQGISEQTIQDNIYFEVDFDGDDYNIRQVKDSVLVWKNKGMIDENW